MNLKDRSLPHPVLAPFRDDVSPNACELNVDVRFDADNYYIRLALSYENESIRALAESGLVAHAYKVECRRNFYRQMFRARAEAIELAIPAGELLGKIEVTGMALAVRPIGEYRVSGSHADYGEASFDISIGDVVAIALQRTFDAYTDYDPLRKVSSFLIIQESESSDDGPMELDTTGDKIVATLSKGDFKRYGELRPDLPVVPLLANQVIVPALLQALAEMATDQTDDQRDEAKARSRWYRSVDRRLRELGIDIWTGTHTPLYAAQVLLREPLRRSLATLQQVTAEEAD